MTCRPNVAIVAEDHCFLHLPINDDHYYENDANQCADYDHYDHDDHDDYCNDDD